MLATRIVMLRKRNGLSQAQLATRLNITPSAMGMYEQGRRFPNMDTLVLMSKIFGVSLDYLITGKNFSYAEIDTDEKRIPENCPCSTCFWKEYIGL